MVWTPSDFEIYFSCWHSSEDAVVINERVGLNLAYSQTVTEIERGWILASKDIVRQLAALQARGAKKEVKNQKNGFVIFPTLFLSYFYKAIDVICCFIFKEVIF